VHKWDFSWQRWKFPLFGGVAMFGAYWLILWAYQISPQASYVVALRQFSIVLGVVTGSFLFREPARGLRISASLIIVVGIVLIILGG
jgi:drug/metabolite transporter (DMT)-like permease